MYVFILFDTKTGFLGPNGLYILFKCMFLYYLIQRQVRAGLYILFKCMFLYYLIQRQVRAGLYNCLNVCFYII